MEETIVLNPLDLQASAVIDYATHLQILCVFSSCWNRWLDRWSMRNMYLILRLCTGWSIWCSIPWDGGCKLWLLAHLLTTIFTNSVMVMQYLKSYLLAQFNLSWAHLKVWFLVQVCVPFSTCLVECDGDQFLKMGKFWSAAAEFMAFKPSEIAASVALVALGKYDSSILESVVTCCKQLRKVLHIRHHSPQSRNAIWFVGL